MIKRRGPFPGGLQAGPIGQHLIFHIFIKHMNSVA
jgi:hypothetical protein